jgi:hypothetical protein
VARNLAARVIAGVVAGAAGLLTAGQALGQTPYTRAITQSSLAVPCVEPGCDCIDANGLPQPCPAPYVREYNSENQPGPTSDSDVASVSGSLLAPYDSTTTSSMEIHCDADFGTLKGLVLAHMDSAGAYADAGGLASGGTADGFADVSFTDVLTVTAAVPGGMVSLAIGQTITSAHSASVGGGGLAIDPCLANGQAHTQLNANLQVTTLTGTGGGLAQYGHITHSCNPPQTTGSPTRTLTVNVPDGDTATISHGITVDAYARADGGEGGVAHPNRARTADALLDASNTAKVYVKVLTPGATYASASGTVYEVPEAGVGAGAAAALASLLAATGLRRLG